jgi:hypothetical protein
MPSPERRKSQRFKLRTPLSFHCPGAPSECEHHVKAINISARGVYFATSLALNIGEFIEVLIEIPRRVTGERAMRRRFSGRVTHIELGSISQGLSGIGVVFLYYEALARTERSTSGGMAISTETA